MTPKEERRHGFLSRGRDADLGVLVSEAREMVSNALRTRQVTDEELRHAFTRAPKEPLAALADQGWELTGVEVDALLRTDMRLWSDAAARLDPRLRCSSLKPGEERGGRA